ncbi:isochorismatase family protein [Nitriliruptor alkaliphilus]|uniref:isochorismatase family protein n=1 Tax=Nitriliruptor alkaliphilus TaxID=427918 RepID=UPI0009FA1CE2|nr:isochorismatase family protein [Nitriliruptor alkaliphilus]
MTTPATPDTEQVAPRPYDGDTALVVVDVQHDFAHPDGGLFVPGGDRVVEVVDGEVRAALDAGATVAYTQDWHPPTTPHFAKDGGVWPVHCVADTWGAQLHDDLLVEGPVVRKGVDGGDGYSGFSVRDPVSGEEEATELGRLLDEAGVHRVVVVGLAGDVCVKETALDAVRLGYDVELPLPATAFVELEPGDGDRAITELRRAGVLVTGRGPAAAGE